MNFIAGNEQTVDSSKHASLEKSAQPFSHLQWYLHRARNTVYLAAESSKEFTQEDLRNIASLFMGYAPQLNCNVTENEDGHRIVDVPPETICEFEEVDNLHSSLARTLKVHDRIYGNSQLPNFRAYGFRRKTNGKAGARSLYVCCSSHALMEGSESARIVRARPSVHQAGQTDAGLSLIKRTVIAAAGLILAPLHLATSAFNRVDNVEGQWAIIDIDRKSIKKLAKQYGVRQRSVLFSIPMFGLHFAEGVKNKSAKKKQLISYSTLPDSKSTLEDTALNLRMQVGNVPTAADFETHVKNNSKVLDREDTTEVYSQAFYNSVLGIHRALYKVFPFFYGRKFFTYVPYDFVLSLLPPHIASGPFRKLFDGSIFCGSYTPGVNNCVYVPYRNGFSLNLYLAQNDYENLEPLMNLLDELGIKARRII